MKSQNTHDNSIYVTFWAVVKLGFAIALFFILTE